VAPLVDQRPRLPTLVALAALAGLPAVAGIWLGSYAFAPHWAALAFAIGAGAILQVIVEVGLLLARRSARQEGRGVATVASGVVAGVAVMYATALLVQV
jgi:zinc transporter, ZIP family